MDAERVDHIGIAVRDLEKALSFWRDRLGLPIEGVEDVPEMKVRVAKLRVGETRIELLCPLAGEEAVTRFLEKRGEGIHHVCLAVPDADAATAELKGKGVTPVYEAARTGAGGHRVNFLPPKETGGVLIEVSS